jgi:hypothetical protein
MNKHFMTSALLVGALAFSPAWSYAQGFSSRHTTKKNAAGGVTSSTTHEAQGPNGGRARSGQGVATDGQGNAVGGSAGAFKTPGGTKGARASSFKRSSDGSVDYHSSGAISGARGHASTSSSFNKDGQGNASGSRSTNATSNSGATYQGSTTYNSGSGATHSATCTNASGESVPCPR